MSFIGAQSTATLRAAFLSWLTAAWRVRLFYGVLGLVAANYQAMRAIFQFCWAHGCSEREGLSPAARAELIGDLLAMSGPFVAVAAAPWTLGLWRLVRWPAATAMLAVVFLFTAQGDVVRWAALHLCWMAKAIGPDFVAACQPIPRNPLLALWPLWMAIRIVRDDRDPFFVKVYRRLPPDWQRWCDEEHAWIDRGRVRRRIGSE